MTVLQRVKALSSAAILCISSAQAAVVTPSTDANALADLIIGTGITRVGAANYSGVANQGGTFTGGTSANLGIDTGVLLTTGDASASAGANTDMFETVGNMDGLPDLSADLTSGGNARLDGVAATAFGGGTTQDTAALQFDFQIGDGSSTGSIELNVVFASEEYVDFENTGFNDVFGVFLDGTTNLALIPPVSGAPISVDTINSSTNSSLWRNNNSLAANSAGTAFLPQPDQNIQFKFDGFTTVLTLSMSNLAAGVHNMEIAIGDINDGLWDSGLFIESASFTGISSPSVATPGPAGLPLMALMLAGFAARYRRR